MSSQFLHDNLAERETKSISVLMFSVFGHVCLENGVNVIWVNARTGVGNLHYDILAVLRHVVTECDASADGVLEGVADEVAKHLCHSVDVRVEYDSLAGYACHKLNLFRAAELEYLLDVRAHVSEVGWSLFHLYLSRLNP